MKTLKDYIASGDIIPLTDSIFDIMKSSPEKIFSVLDLCDPGTTIRSPEYNNVLGALKKLVQYGKIDRVKRGQYKICQKWI